MTPLEIKLALHYYSSPTDYNDGDFSAPSVAAAIDKFLSEEIIKLRMPRGYSAITVDGHHHHAENKSIDPYEVQYLMDSKYELAFRGKRYVNALMQMGLPQSKKLKRSQ